MIVVVALDEGRWPLLQGQDPDDLLAEQGWVGQPVRAVRGEDDAVELHYRVTALPTPAPGALPVPEPTVLPIASRARTHQRLGAYALVVDEDRLLMSQLSDRVTTAAGLWSLPGGGVDPGEEPVDGVVREVYEEAGQHVIVDDLVQVQSMHWVGEVGAGGEPEDFHAVRLIYRADCPRPTPAHVVEIDGSTGDAAWVPLADVATLPLVGMVGEAWPFVPGSKSYLM